MGQNGHFCIFFYLFPQNEAEITRNGQFHLIHNCSHLLPPKHLIFGEISKIFISGGGYIGKFFEFSHFFKSQHTNLAENDPQWQIWPKKWFRLGQNGHFCIFFYLSPQNEAEITRNGQFHLIHNFSHLLPPKHLIFREISKIFISSGGGGTLAIFFEFSNFFKSFHTNVAGNDPQWQIWPKKWLRLGQNGHFCIFFYLFPQNEAGITRNGQFHLIHNFSHLLPPKRLIFGEISKIFIWGGMPNPMGMVSSVYNK